MHPGATYGPYRVLGLLGEGGMGSVFIAEHTLVGRRAAIKVLRPELSARRSLVERFFNEARVMAALSDPGIVQLFDFGYAADGSAYIVMELLEGESLEQRIDRLGALDPVDALRIVRQAATTLAGAHARGVVHRDLKPDNIFLVRDAEAASGERAKLLDFGIAKLSDDNPNRVKTQAGAFMGTPLYMAPEQCSGDGVVDHRADIYSLGCVLFHLVTGRVVFERPGLGSLVTAHMTERPAAPSSIAPGLPRELDALVLCCLAKLPDDRFQSMLELRAACDTLLGKLGYGASRPGTAPIVTTAPPATRVPAPTTLSASVGQTSPSAVAARAPARRRWVAVATGITAGVVAIAVVVALGSLGGSGDQRPGAVRAVAPAELVPVPAPHPVQATTVPIAVDAGVVAIDATIDAAAVAAQPRPVAPLVKTVAHPPPVAKPRPVKPPRSTDEDMYDNR